MDLFIGTLLMILGAVASNPLAKLLPGRPALPIVQIAMGALIGATTNISIMLDPDLFFLMFLPPLLFLDGWRVPKDDLMRNAPTILSLAVGLVVFTVLGIGFLVNLAIPAIPLAVAFALASVLAPTDVVAASAMAKDVVLPRRLLHILEGEALFNDASGLVCLRFAVAAALTGGFSFVDSVGTFVWLALGGIAIGLATTWAISWMKLWVATRYGEDTSSQILVSLLMPFAAYLSAEQLGCSAVLAAVSAGMMMSHIEIGGSTLAITRVRRRALWDTLQFALNGIVFVLLGEQLPAIVQGAVRSVSESGHHDAWWLVAYAIGLMLALYALRFIWGWIAVSFSRLLRGPAEERGRGPDARLIAVMSVAGVRGAVTLAAVLSLPLALPDGSPFPARDLAIFLASAVIVLSLVVANIALPRLLRGAELPAETPDRRQEIEARIQAAHAAIAAISSAADSRRKAHPASSDAGELEAAAAVADIYRRRLQRLAPADPTQLANADPSVERQFRLAALRAERARILKMAHDREIGNELAHMLLREIDLGEVPYQN
ncbi:MAG TPA: Na+/H+ antiporter [Ancylobacter sp.]